MDKYERCEAGPCVLFGWHDVNHSKYWFGLKSDSGSFSCMNCISELHPLVAAWFSFCTVANMSVKTKKTYGVLSCKGVGQTSEIDDHFFLTQNQECSQHLDKNWKLRGIVRSFGFRGTTEHDAGCCSSYIFNRISVTRTTSSNNKFCSWIVCEVCFIVVQDICYRNPLHWCLQVVKVCLDNIFTNIDSHSLNILGRRLRNDSHQSLPEIKWNQGWYEQAFNNNFAVTGFVFQSQHGKRNCECNLNLAYYQRISTFFRSRAVYLCVSTVTTN